jgi:hypothetical protein
MLVGLIQHHYEYAGREAVGKMAAPENKDVGFPRACSAQEPSLGHIHGADMKTKAANPCSASSCQGRAGSTSQFLTTVPAKANPTTANFMMAELFLCEWGSSLNAQGKILETLLRCT